MRQNLQKSRETAFLFTACFSIQNCLSVCCYFVLSQNISILYNATVSELAEGWQQNSYSCKAGHKPLPLSSLCTAQAPHSHTWEPRNSHDQKIWAFLCNRNIIMCSQLHLFTSLAGRNVYCCLFHVT